jgi:hypothetical protein
MTHFISSTFDARYSQSFHVQRARALDLFSVKGGPEALDDPPSAALPRSTRPGVECSIISMLWGVPESRGDVMSAPQGSCMGPP